MWKNMLKIGGRNKMYKRLKNIKQNGVLAKSLKTEEKKRLDTRLERRMSYNLEGMAARTIPEEKMIPRNVKKAVAIRVYGKGDLVIAAEYPPDSDKPVRTIATAEILDNAFSRGIPVWIDSERMSQLQRASVINTIRNIQKNVGSIEMAPITQDGRNMILAYNMEKKMRNAPKIRKVTKKIG